MILYHATMEYKIVNKFFELLPNKKLSVLQSFANLGNIHKFIENKGRLRSLIIDSGTFTKNNSNDPGINLYDYISFLKEHGHKFDFYFNFDENFYLDGGEMNYDNMIQMEHEDLTPVPVVRDISFELDDIIEEGYSYIALASPQLNKVEDFELAMKKIEGTKIKIHLLGDLTYEFLANFPINSVDATTWTKFGAHGSIYFWNPEGKTDIVYLGKYRWENKKNTDKDYLNYEFRTALDQYLRERFGITREDMLKDRSGFWIQLVNLDYLVKYEEILNKVHKEKGFDTDYREEILEQYSKDRV